MRTIDKIIESQEAPKDKNVLWVKGDKLLSHVNGKWTPVGGGSSDNVQGGGSSSGGGFEYIRYSDIDESNVAAHHLIKQGAMLVKITVGGQTMITPSGVFFGVPSTSCELLAFGIDFNQRVVVPNMSMTFKENLISQGITEEYLASIPRITEEEFYTI